MNISEELEQLGLSEKEAKVYVSLLELGQSNVQIIAKKAGINRPIAYVVLDALVKKGLCSTFEKDKKAFYVAQDPEHLQMLLNVQKRELEEKQARLSNVMENLKTIHDLQDKERPFVRFFEGKEGLLGTRTESYAKAGDTVRLLYPLEGFQDFYSEAERTASHAQRSGNKIFAKVLYTSKGAPWPPDPSRETLQLTDEKYPFAADITLFGDSKIRITSLNEKLSGVIIDDPEIYKTFVSLYELAWLGVQSLNNKSKE